jgi:transposase-like protein
MIRPDTAPLQGPAESGSSTSVGVAAGTPLSNVPVRDKQEHRHNRPAATPTEPPSLTPPDGSVTFDGMDLTPEQRQEIVRLRRGPPRLSMSEVARRVGTTKQTVSNVIRQLAPDLAGQASRDPAAVGPPAREAHARQAWQRAHAAALMLPTGTSHERLARDLALGLLMVRGPDTSLSEVARRGKHNRRHLLRYERGAADQGQPVNLLLSTLAEVADAYGADVELVIRPKRQR